jgi:quercetin dioxygenase-like cupin family protein
MLVPWSGVEKRQLNPLTVRQVIHGDHMTIARFDLRRGATVPEHTHHNEQILTVQSGSVRLVVAGEEIVVRPGQVLRIPPNIRHSAEAVEDSVTVETFSPPREDWK